MMESLLTMREGAALWLSLEVVRATVLLAIAVGAALVLRRASAATRHLVWCATLVSLLALPLVSAVLPWRWSPVTSSAVPAATTAQQARSVADAELEPRESATTLPPNAVRPVREPGLAQRALAFGRAHVLAIVLAVWIAGALLSLARLAIGGLTLRRLVRRAAPLTEPEWRTPLYEAADRLDLRVEPRLVRSERMPMPFVTGLLRPVVVLPAASAAWSAERRRAVLLHELAHVRRRDLLLNTVAHVACALWWFHPLARMAAQRLRAESERACDDLVLRLGTRPSTYADHLLQIVRDAGRVAAPAVALPMAQRREFEGRMLAILEADARRDPPRRRHAVLAAVAFAVLILPLAGLGPVAAEVRQMQADPPAPAFLSDARVDRGDTGSDADLSADDVDAARAEVEAGGDAEARAEGAARTASMPQDTGVVGALRAALRDPSGEVRSEAAWALGSMRATTAGPDLVPLLTNDVHAETRRMVVWALVQLDHAAAANAIATAARSDDDAEVREMATWALGQFGDPATLPALVAALGDEDAEVRSIAAWAIGSMEPEDAPAALLTALEDADGEVREHAAWAAGQIGDADALPALTRLIADDDAGEAAMWAIGNIGGDAARPALMEALRNGNDDVRAAAARALAGRSGSRPWPWPWPRPMPRY